MFNEIMNIIIYLIRSWIMMSGVQKCLMRSGLTLISPRLQSALSFRIILQKNEIRIFTFCFICRKQNKLFHHWTLIIGWLTTGRHKKHETWKTTWWLLIDLLLSVKSPSVKTNMRKISVMFTVFIQIFKHEAFSLFTRVHIISKKISMSHVFWDSLYI